MATRRPSTRVRYDPATAAAVMADPSALHIVRHLAVPQLERAYRVHLPQPSLEQAGLKLGDLCEISSEDGTTGYGIAWRADDHMGARPKNRPIKMTEVMRSAFAFQDGSRVAVAPTSAKMHHADKIVLSDITPDEFSKREDLEDGRWEPRVGGLFSNCEALTPGISFDLLDPRRKLRKRYYIEDIESASIPHDAPGLFEFTKRTELVFPPQNSNPTGQPNSTPDGSMAPMHPSLYRLNTDSIGGLSEQCNHLNYRLGLIFHESSSGEPSRPIMNDPILLHGFEGTGKTLLMKRLTEAPFHKTIRLNRESLNSGNITKNKTIIQSSFQEAVTNQPSLIVMDDLERLVPTDDHTYTQTIADEIDKIISNPHLRVLIVGAARSTTNIHPSLLGAPAFIDLIELPIPDLTARAQIWEVLQGRTSNDPDSLSSSLASRTSGFTAKDLATLYKTARAIFYRRIDHERLELRMQWHRLPPQTPTQVPSTPSPPQSPMTSSQPPTSAPPRYSQLSNIVELTDHKTPLQQMSTPDTFRSNTHSMPESSPKPASKGLTSVSSHAVVDEKMTFGDIEQALLRVRPTALREIHTERPKTQWRDIGGSAGLEKTFSEIIDWPRDHPEVCKHYRLQQPKGVLLYGPPGCSKTLTAQAVANTHGLNFIAIKGAELISMYVGESERAIREVFRKARAAAPCVIFFDEIDSIGGSRDGGGGGGGAKGLNVLTTLLNEMDGFEKLESVLILAATNRPETLDPALMRPGRFDSHVYIGPPNEAARREILAISMGDTPADIDIDTLIRRTDGFSGAEIVNICNKARTQTARRHVESGASHLDNITAADFDYALESTVKGITDEMLESYDAFAKRKA